MPAPVWIPSDLGANLPDWWKADALTPSDGAFVASWTDASGNGRHLTEDTNYPTWQADEINGLPVIRFDGVSQQLAVADTGIVAQPFSFALVVKMTSVGGDVFHNGATFSLLNNSAAWLIFAGSVLSVGDDAAPTPFRVLTGVVNGVSSLGSINGVASATGDPGAGILDDLTIGTVLAAGAIAGDLAELFLGDTAWDTDTRQNAEGYLAWKYGLQGELPGDHPYADIWTPALLDGDTLTRWFDAGQNDVLVDNTEVDHWVDASPNAENIPSAVHEAAAKPTIQTNELDTKPVMRFAGGQYFDTGADFPLEGDRFTFAFVEKKAATESNDDYWTSRIPNDAAISAHAWNTFALEGRDSIFSVNAAEDFLGIRYAITNDTDWHIHVEVFNRGDSLGSHDGTVAEHALFGGGNLTGASIASGFTIAWDIGPAGAGVPSLAFNGDMAEFLVFNGALTELARQVVEGYLAWKYGLEANLVAGHPYEDAAPLDDALDGEDFFVPEGGPVRPLERLLRAPIRWLLHRSPDPGSGALGGARRA